MSGERLGGFGDARLERVGTELLAAMRRQRTLCVHRLAKDRNEAMRFLRFLGNSAVSSPEMLAEAGRQTGVRAADRHVLAIQNLPLRRRQGILASRCGLISSCLPRWMA